MTSIIFVLANTRIPGKVINRTANGSLFIEPLIDRIPLDDGGFATEFFTRNGDADRGDFITFMWSKPGERGIDPSTGKPANPRAKNVTVVREEDAENLRNEILNLLAEKEKEQVEELKIQLEREYQNKQEKLEQDHEQLNQERENLEQEKSDLNSKREYLENQRKIIQEEKNELIKIEQEISRYKSLLTLVDNREREIIIAPSSVPKNTDLEPEDLGDRWREMLESRNQILPDSIAIGYLISMMTALCSGSMVLLNGNVGVGKSSIVTKSAELLGGNAEIIPIRPSWLDPSDLLGFFDPLSETFRPSTFTTALKTAANSPDRPFFICLDELNLARIENYGADLLSTLEYSKNRTETGDKKRNLSLYSQDIEIHLWKKLELLKKLENLSIEQQLLIAQLDLTLSTMPSKCEIPQNLLLIGTLNSDETTYDLSPKVIDRSYVITYPPVNFRSLLPRDGKNSGEQLSVSQFQDKVNKCVQHIENSAVLVPGVLSGYDNLSDRIANTWHKDWGQITRWNEDYISQLGIPLGYRVRRDYQIFFAGSHCLGITKDNSNKCLAYFLFAKLLPRISFFKDPDKELENLCQKWIAEIRQDYSIGGESYILEQLERQISDSGRRNVRYWG